jgi:hypothetical protein
MHNSLVRAQFACYNASELERWVHPPIPFFPVDHSET